MFCVGVFMGVSFELTTDSSADKIPGNGSLAMRLTASALCSGVMAIKNSIRNAAHPRNGHESFASLHDRSKSGLHSSLHGQAACHWPPSPWTAAIALRVPRNRRPGRLPIPRGIQGALRPLPCSKRFARLVKWTRHKRGKSPNICSALFSWCVRFVYCASSMLYRGALSSNYFIGAQETWLRLAEILLDGLWRDMKEASR